jgi:hypothetical protein
MAEPVLLPESELNAYGVKEYFVNPTFGASSITTYFGGCNVTIVRNSAGNYTITLPKAYRTLLHFTWGFQMASGAVLDMVLASETLATDGKMIFESRVSAGTATDPGNGAKVFIRIVVSSDYMNDKFQV